MINIITLFAVRNIWEHLSTTLGGVFTASLVLMPMLNNPEIESWRIWIAMVIVVGGAFFKGPKVNSN